MGARDFTESVPITTLSIVVLAVTASVIAMGGMIRIYDAGEIENPSASLDWGDAHANYRRAAELGGFMYTGMV